MHRPTMPSTERDSELIADLAAERTGLGETTVVGIRGLAAAHESGLLGDVSQVLPVAIATRGGDREDALVDALCLAGVDAIGTGIHLRPGNLRHRRIIVRGCGRLG